MRAFPEKSLSMEPKKESKIAVCALPCWLYCQDTVNTVLKFTSWDLGESSSPIFPKIPKNKNEAFYKLFKYLIAEGLQNRS